MHAAVAAATAKKFVWSIWEGAFIVVNRFRVDSIKWIEWDFGPCASRFGTLEFFFHPGKQRKEDCKIGIVKIPDEAWQRDDDVWRKIETWIKRDAPMLITGHLGKDNEQDIAEVAVAAYASVGHLIRVKTCLEGSFAWAPSGFLMCAVAAE